MLMIFLLMIFLEGKQEVGGGDGVEGGARTSVLGVASFRGQLVAVEEGELVAFRSAHPVVLPLPPSARMEYYRRDYYYYWY